jgi:hypothetical protein
MAGRSIAWATLVAGTLDILMAIVTTAISGGSVPGMLAGIASGPFGDGVRDSSMAAPLGLLVHFAIMAAIVAIYFLGVRAIPRLNRHWWLTGLVYGFGVWIVMYWIVLPVRFTGFLPPADPVDVATGLFAHCILVGLPIAWFAARNERRLA